uniref:Uncharacterized protein n=1 Tax=Rhipicephalus appendiculatus TaxID=34631 RepID=A0A131YAH5_RHIAP
MGWDINPLIILCAYQHFFLCGSRCTFLRQKKISATASKKARTKKQVGLGLFHITAWQTRAAPHCLLRACAYSRSFRRCTPLYGAYQLGGRCLCIQVNKMGSSASLHIYNAFLCVKKKKNFYSSSGIPNV